MPLGIYDKIKPKGEFAIADAADIEMQDGKRLDAALEEIKNAAESGGVSSWNDLTDKPFGEESGTEVLLEETTFNGFMQNPLLGLFYLVTDAPLFLVAGETYIVRWDGEEYVCVAEDASAVYGSEMTMIGNAAAFGLSGNGEPFIIGTDTSKIYYYVSDPADSALSHTIGIHRNTTVIKTLDPKYLPVEAEVSAVDLSGYESNGVIVETYADGSTVTYTFEFDENGNPTKITDSNGNETVLTW